MVRAVLLPIHPVTDHLRSASTVPTSTGSVQFSPPPPNKQAYVPINTNPRGECLCSISRAKTAHAHAAGLIDNPASQPGQTSSTRPLSHRAVKVATLACGGTPATDSPWVIGSSSPLPSCSQACQSGPWVLIATPCLYTDLARRAGVPEWAIQQTKMGAIERPLIQ